MARVHLNPNLRESGLPTININNFILMKKKNISQLLQKLKTKSEGEKLKNAKKMERLTEEVDFYNKADLRELGL